MHSLVPLAVEIATKTLNVKETLFADLITALETFHQLEVTGLQEQIVVEVNINYKKYCMRRLSYISILVIKHT